MSTMSYNYRVPISVTVPLDLVNAVEEARGKVARSKFVEEALRAYLLKLEEKNAKQEA